MDSQQNSQTVGDDITVIGNTYFLPGITVDDFLDKDIIDLMGGQEMPEEQRQKVREKMFQTIQHRIILKLANLLNQEDFDALREALKTNNQDGFEEIVAKYDLELDLMYAEEALLYKTQMVNLVNNAS